MTLKRIKDYTDKEGNKWEVYTYDMGFWRYYYMGLTYNELPITVELAFAINKEHNYNGDKKDVILRNLADFAKQNQPL